MDGDFIRRDAEQLCSGGLIGPLELRASPDFAPITVELDGAVQRFHRGVGEIGGLEPRIQLARSTVDGLLLSQGCI